MGGMRLPLLLILACAGPESTDSALSESTAVTQPTPPGPGATQTGNTGTVSPCPMHMALVQGQDGPFCIDRYEAWLEGRSPYEVVEDTDGIATTGPGEAPQGYISQTAAAAACTNANKRLCTTDEWMRACQGPAGWTYPYGNDYDPSACNEGRAHPVITYFGSTPDWSTTEMNHPALNQLADGLAAGGDYAACLSAEGVWDLHGNLHEWIDDPDGTFKGGFYVDAVINGAGCGYTTTAHTVTYHDYSTGFRCCSETQ